MIGKSKTGKNFKGLVYYCLQKEKNAEVLDLNGLSHSDSRGLIREFNVIRSENQNISRPVWHSSLSFSKQDKISNDKMVEIANRFMEKAGFTKENNQFIIIKHNDKEYAHCHIIANRVGFDGSAVSDYYCKTKSVQWAKQIENEYDLVKVQELSRKKMIEKTLEKSVDPNVIYLKEAINNVLKQPGINTLSNLAQNLLLKGIDMQILKHAKTGLEYGVSFSVGDKSYKGSEIGKQYAFKSLSNSLSPTLKVVKTVTKIIAKGLTQGM